MASISTLQESSSSSNPHTYDVFLSFRGEDTRNTFTGHLYNYLKERDIHTFKDDEKLETGGDIASDLSRAIDESKIFIIIFSKHYADSKWCLNELVKIIDCMTEKKSVVLPVFYHVKPRDVRNQKGSFEDAFSEHAKGADQEKKKTIETWKNALKTAGNLKGYELQNQSEAKVIQEIREDIIIRLNDMNHQPLHVGDSIVGMDFHVEQLKSLIKTELDEVHMVGICGTGGIENKLDMHDLVQQMGQEVVRQECLKEPGNRSRLWNENDVDSMLTRNTGSQAIEGLFVQSSLASKISTNSFTKMNRLRLLEVYYPQFWQRDFEALKNLDFPYFELRYFHFEGYPLESLPTNFHAKHLVELNLEHSSIKQLWKGNEILDNLKAINLSYSTNLVEISDFSRVTNLEILILKGCDSLESFPAIKGDMSKLREIDLSSTGIEAIRHLKALQHLDLSDCNSLRSLSESICNLSSLETLILEGCSYLKGFPEIKDDMENLKMLDLSETGIEELPSSIGHLKALQHLDFSYCKRLRSLPESICNLSSLETLTLEECSNLKGFPEIKDDMENLKMPDLSFTGIEELPSSIGRLKALKHLNLKCCTELVSLPDSICNLSSLETLILEGCSNLKGFPEIKDDMENLKKLDLSFTCIKELPSSIGRLKALKHLNLKCCTELVSLLDSIFNLSSLKTLDVRKCPKLERVEVNLVGSLDLTCCILKQRVISWRNNLGHDEVEGEVLNHHVSSLSSLVESCTRDYRGIVGDRFHLSALEVLSVGNFSPIQRRILSDIFRQSSLKSVSLRNCNLMEEGIPSDSWNLSSLVNLSPSNCSLTEGEILNHICHISSLQNLSLDGNHFSSIPANIIQLSELRSLHLNHCLKLLQIPQLPPSLRVLDVHDCPCLETLSSPSSLLCFSMFECFKSAIEETERRPYWSKEITIFFLGNNGIPEWISHKEKGSEIVVELPENWWEDNNFLGFALCSVIVPLHIETKEDPLSLKCKLNFPHYFEYPDGFVSEFWPVDELSFRRSYPCCHNGGESNRVWVACYPKVAIDSKYWSNEFRHLKASFDGGVKVEECGLHLIYKTNIFNRDSNATNHWPRLLSENTNFNVKRSLDDAENPHNKKSRLL